MKNIYFCFGCLEEFTFGKVAHECIKCGASDIVDITEKAEAKKRIEAQKHFLRLPEMPSRWDLLDWKYGNDYSKFVN